MITIFIFIQDESDTARDLKNMLVILKFQKPPDNISPELLFSKLETKLSEVLKTVPPHYLDKPLIDVELSTKQWEQLGKLQEEMHKEYTTRRDMLLKRLDVTVQSFLVRTNALQILLRTYRPVYLTIVSFKIKM